MAWDELLLAVENRFRTTIDTDGIPTTYENLRTEKVTVDGPPKDDGAGLRRSVSWVFGEDLEFGRGREYTPVRMVVKVGCLFGIGIADVMAHAQQIRATLHASMLASPIEGVHYDSIFIERVGKTEQGTYEVNCNVRVTFEEVV